MTFTTTSEKPVPHCQLAMLAASRALNAVNTCDLTRTRHGARRRAVAPLCDRVLASCFRFAAITAHVLC